jgi:hypothetical protein
VPGPLRSDAAERRSGLDAATLMSRRTGSQSADQVPNGISTCRTSRFDRRGIAKVYPGRSRQLNHDLTSMRKRESALPLESGIQMESVFGS